MEVKCPFCGADIGAVDPIAKPQVDCPSCSAVIDVATALVFAGVDPGTFPGSPASFTAPARSGPVDPLFLDDVPPATAKPPADVLTHRVFDEPPVAARPPAPPPPPPPRPAAPPVAAPAPRVEGIGSYGKRSNDLIQAREVVFAPGAERPAHKAPPVTAAANEARRSTSSFTSRPPSSSSPRPGAGRMPPSAGRADPFWEPSQPEHPAPVPPQPPSRLLKQEPPRPAAPRQRSEPMDEMPVARSRTPEFIVEVPPPEPAPRPSRMPEPPSFEPYRPSEPTVFDPQPAPMTDVFGQPVESFDLSSFDAPPDEPLPSLAPEPAPTPSSAPAAVPPPVETSDMMELPSFDDFSAFLSDDERPAPSSTAPAPVASGPVSAPPMPSIEDLGLPETGGSLSGEAPVVNPAVVDPFGPMTGGGEDLGLSFDDLVLPEPEPGAFTGGPQADASLGGTARGGAAPGIDLDSLLGEDSTASARRSWAAPGGGMGGGGEPLQTLELGSSSVWPSGLQVDGDGLSSIADETLPDPGVFDLELAGGPELVGGPLPPPSPNGIVIQAKPGTAGVRQDRKGKGSGKVVLLGVLLVVLAGVTLGQTPYGYFGMNLLKDKPGKRPVPIAAAGGPDQPATDSVAGLARDTRDAYIEEATRLETALKEDSDSDPLRDELRLVLTRMNMRFPASLAADAALSARFEAAKKTAMSPCPAAEFVRALDLVAEGKGAEAIPVLETLAASPSAEADVFVALGRIEMDGGRPEEARRRFEGLIAKAPNAIEARYWLARLQLADKDPEPARASAAAILERVPQHAGAKLVLARTALAAHDYDRAIQIADDVSSAGASLDPDDLFESRLVVVAVRRDQKDKARLLVALQAALALRPEHEDTAIETSTLLREAGRKDEALAALGACRKRGIVSEAFLAAYAAAAFGAGREDEGNQVIQEGREKFPKSARFPLVDADRLVAAGRLASAVALYEEALKLDPASEEGMLKIADVLARQGKGAEAVTRMRAMLEKAGERVPLMVAMAGIQVGLRDFQGAESVLRRAQAVEPSSAAVQTALGRVLFAQGRTDEAVRVLAAMDGRGQLDRAGMLALSAAYMDLRQPEKARDAMARLHEGAEGDAEVAAEFARTLMETNANDRAGEVLRKAIAESPLHAGLHLQLGRLLFRTGDKDGAVSAIQRSVQLDQANQKTRLELVRVLLSRGTHEASGEAKGLLETIIAAYARGAVPAEEREADAYLFRGRLSFEKQGFAPALKDFESALTLAPSRMDILVATGRALYELARYGDASNYFRQILARDKGQPEANYYLGRIVMREGKIEDAKAYLQACVARTPGLFPDAHRQLGLIYRDQGIRPLAKSSLTKYLEYAPKGSSEAEEVRRILERM